MAEAFIGEIRALPYTFVPYGWLACDGTQYNIQEYQALYALIGNVFGGSASSNTFKVPDLRGYAGIGVGANALGTYTMGQTVGQTSVTLTQAQLPNHDHGLQTQAAAARLTAPSPAALPFVPSYLHPNTKTYGLPMYVSATTAPTPVAMSTSSVGVAGGTEAHNNQSPLLILRFCINWDGYFPNLQN